MDRPGPFSDSRRQSQQNFNKSGNFLKFFFRGSISERNVQSYISNEGSIHQNVWNGMNKNANWKVRLKTVENLEELARKRRLQVSVLEGVFHFSHCPHRFCNSKFAGIWAETNDMLHQESLRKAFLSLMCSLTKAQNEELGLALRSTFFEAIQTIGLEEASLRWLLALTDEGKILEPFEYKLGDLLTEWLEVVFKFEHHPLASEVILLTERVVVRNSTFLDEKTLKYIVHNSCKRISQNSTSLVLSLLSCLEAILKYSHVPKSELFPLVTCVCLLISNSSHSSSSWKLMRLLLTSVNAYSVFRMLQSLLTNFFHLHSADIPKNSLIMIVRGAVFCVAMSLWGSQRIESLRCSPSIIIPSLAEAMVLDPLIANEVVTALRRVIGKYGKSLQQPTWSCILQTLEKAIKYAKTNVNSNELYIELVSIISSIENMQLDNKFCGSVEAFFNLLEQSSDFLPDESVLRLIDYKAECIDPCCGDWINQMLALIQKYIHQSNSAKRREKALYILRSTYYKYKLLYETDVIRGLVLKICTMIPNESNSNFQYEMITFVFDVARSVSLRVNSRNDVFMEIISLIRESFNCRKMKSETAFVDHGVDNDNLEIIACHIEELLNERWTALDPSLIQAVFDLLVEHLKTLYSSKMQDLSVPEVRARIFETLLRVHSHPLNQQLVKSMVLPNMSQKVLLINSRIIVGEEGFKWNSICEITIRAMQTELCWRVIKKVLECLVNVLEFRSFVYSAGQHLVNQLSEALLDLNTRFENGQFVGLERSELSKYLCPVLGRLINYYQQARLCKILDLAVQVLPKKMTLYNRQLMENLTRIRPNAQVAIPLLELIGDSADVSEFFQFFQEKHFRSVVDVLAPYSSCRHFNLFIIASVHRVILRWFSKVQEDMRNAMSQYILQTFTAANEKPELSLMPSQSTKSGALVQTCSSHKGQDRSSKDLSGATEVNSTLAKDYKSSSASLNLSESSNFLGNAATPVPISHSGEEIVQVVQPFVISHSDVLANQLRLDDEINFMCSGQWDDLTPKSTSFSIGPSNTPEISPSIEMHHQQWMSAEHVRRLNNWDVTEDAFESMQLFMRYWKKKMHSCQSSPDSPNSYKNFLSTKKKRLWKTCRKLDNGWKYGTDNEGVG